jgi:fatty acid desaturase
MNDFTQHNKLSGSPQINTIKNVETGESWAEYKRTLKPSYAVVWLVISRNFLMMALGISAFYFICTPDNQLIQILMVFPLALWLGFWLHSNLLFYHEAAHFNVAPSRQWNDLLTTVFISPFAGVSIESYRKIHWEHHLHLGTTKDTETSYFFPLRLKRVIALMTGWFLVDILANYSRNSSEANNNISNTSHAKKEFLIHLLLVILVQLTIAVSLWAAISLWCAVAWLLAFGLISIAFNVLRQTLEHRSFSADDTADYKTEDSGAVNRLFGASFFAGLFGSAGFNRHLLHHWDPSVSYTNFDEMEDFLLHTELKLVLDANRTTYLSALKKLT